jgi:hypothetical protein
MLIWLENDHVDERREMPRAPEVAVVFELSFPPVRAPLRKTAVLAFDELTHGLSRERLPAANVCSVCAPSAWLTDTTERVTASRRVERMSVVI